MKLTKEQFIYQVKEKAAKLGIELNISQLEKFYYYKELLIEWNEKINLTAITDDEEIVVKHIIDSLQAVKYIKVGDNIIDIGTGAGLPGIIIAIYFEGKVNITLFDALNKRIIFLNEIIKSLDLKNAVAVHGRAEETARELNYREKYDVVISRAVATLNVLLELTVPFVKIGGTCIYMKADKANEELISSKKAISELEIKYDCLDKYTIELNDELIQHAIVKFTKIGNTREKYPRQFSKIKKLPL